MTARELIDKLEDLPNYALNMEVSITLYRMGKLQVLRSQSTIKIFSPVVSDGKVNLEISLY